MACSISDGREEPLCYNHYVEKYYDQTVRHRCLQAQEAQSAEITATGVIAEGEAGESKEEVFQFMDENEGGTVGRIAKEYELFNKAQNQDLKDFLRRPIKIYNLGYSSSNNVGDKYTINVWRSYLQNQAVKNKLANYAFLRADLKLKFVINASPFLYGAVLAAYQPLQTLSNLDLNIAASSNTNWFMEKSQQPHVWIYPQTNEGGEMLCPFFFQKNWMDITTITDATNMGILDLIVFCKLASANGVASENVNIGVYAWLENPVLTGPTVAGTLQGKDEYKLSTTASALATLAGTLESIPAIAPFATATQIGATMLAKGLSACGWTNTPNISDVDPYRPTAFPTIASPEISYPVEKLTIDPKNELGVDPGIIGLSNQDELEIKYLITKESFLGQGTWDTSRAPDDILFSCPVHPMLFSMDTISTSAPNPYYQIHHTPLSWVQSLFFNWRGDIIFRFKFICSPFHKGRVKIMFDPKGDATTNIVNTLNTDNVVFTTLVDIGKDTDVEIRVPYLQAVPFLRRYLDDSGFGTTYNFYSSGTTGTFYSGSWCNGMIAMRVVTELTAPVASAPIQFLVSLRAGDNYEMATPLMEIPSRHRFALWKPQGDDHPFHTEDANSISLGLTTPNPSHRYLQNFGERITSLRQLLRRSTFIEARQFPTLAVKDIWCVGEHMPRFPRTYGYDVYGIDLSPSQFSTTAKPFSNVKTNPIAWVMSAFVAVRGSINWTLNFDGQGVALGNVTVSRDVLDTTPPHYTQNSGTATTDGSGFSATAYSYMNDCTSGAIISNQITQAGINVQVPMYDSLLFESADVTLTNRGAIDNVNYNDFSYNITSSLGGTSLNNTRVYKYAGIGTDFNLHYFLHTPAVYQYNNKGL